MPIRTTARRDTFSLGQRMVSLSAHGSIRIIAKRKDQTLGRYRSIRAAMTTNDLVDDSMSWGFVLGVVLAEEEFRTAISPSSTLLALEDFDWSFVEAAVFVAEDFDNVWT